MTRKDTAFVVALLIVLAVIGGAVAMPAFQPSVAVRTATPAPIAESRPYREGVLGGPVSVSPLTARTQADRDLVALLFSGLVRNGPNGTLVPDLAQRWSVSQDGATWTVELRADAAWHDGVPVTAEDVAFTIRTLQDPDYTGPRAASWAGVSVQTTGTRTITFTLQTPLGGFLQALTQPIAPAHLLDGVAAEDLPDHPFGQEPVGSGPFALTTLEPELAVLEPAAVAFGSSSPAATSSASDPPGAAGSLDRTARPALPRPYLDGIEFHYYADAGRLADDFRAGSLDAASGIDPVLAGQLDAEPRTHLLRYPGSTLTAVVFNLRGDRPEFSTPAVRTALLQSIDRDALIDAAFGGLAVEADSAIPRSSFLFDPTASGTVAHDSEAAKAALERAGWTQKNGRWRLSGADEAFEFELLSPDRASNPAAFDAAASVTADWLTLGLGVSHVGLPPGEFVSERLATGDFRAAVIDVAIGLDPDLYPLLASTQTVSGGSNVSGLQDTTLDGLLEAARKPGTDAERMAAYRALQDQLSAGRYLLPLAFRDEVVVVRETLSGPVVRQVADGSDRFWDVLTWRLADDR